MLCAAIIGNGPSRRGLDVKQLSGKMTLFGSNLIYREFNGFDYIGAVDEDIIKIVNSSDYPSHRFLTPSPEDKFELSGSGKLNNTGMFLMHEAIKRGHTHLYCFGFDFLLKDQVASVSNVFDNEEIYAKNKATYADNLNRVSYLKWFVKNFPTVEFTFLFRKREQDIHEVSFPNINGLYYDDLVNELKLNDSSDNK